jgi:hypothetical protein
MRAAVRSSRRFTAVAAVALAAVTVPLAGQPAALAHPPGTTELASLSSMGVAGDADSTLAAVSADGRFVYAAGLPGVDAAGRPKLRQQASITVFDTADGSIRLIAGQLGGDALSFISATLD